MFRVNGCPFAGDVKMNVLKGILLTLLVLSPAGPLQADASADISLALDYFAEVWTEGDLDTLRGYYHPDFVLVTGEGAVALGQRIDDLETIAEAGEDRGELSYSGVEIKPLGEDHAMAYGRLSLKFKDGSALDGWFSTVYVKTPFGWKALLTHN